MFPLGQHFKSLYAVHTLREYVALHRRTAASSQPENHQEGHANASSYPCTAVLTRAMVLVVSAISDPDVIGQCSSQRWQIELSSSLVECFLYILEGKVGRCDQPGASPSLTLERADPGLPPSAAQLLEAPLLDRLLILLTAALEETDTANGAAKHAELCLRSILQSCSMSEAFMAAFCAHEDVPDLLGKLLLYDQRQAIRQTTSLLVLGKADAKMM